jgi:two-component system, OmpR family, response regulator VicR
MKDITRLLVIEDCEDTIESIYLAFQIRWPEVEIISATTGRKGIELAESKTPDLIILDIGLPDINGFDVLRKIRLFSEVPIIILTVRSEEPDVVRGLESGADEYIIKPFRQLELLSHAAALLRRRSASEVKPAISCGPLALDLSTHTASYHGKRVNLTRSESLLLSRLMQNMGLVVSHAALAEELWGDDCPEDTTMCLKVHIRRLRQKIESDPAHPALILTKSGLGYLFAKPD